MTFAEIIRTARESKKWSQNDLAKALGVSRPTVTQWEAGETAPRRGRWRKLENVLGLPAGSIGPHSVSGISILDDTTSKVVNLPVFNLSAITMRSGGGLRLGVSDGNIVAEQRYASSQYLLARVTDEALKPLYGMGDDIIVDKNITPVDGDVVVAGTPGNTLMLRSYNALGRNSKGKDVFELRSTNADYPTIPMDSIDGMKIIGVVIEHRRKRRL